MKRALASAVLLVLVAASVAGQSASTPSGTAPSAAARAGATPLPEPYGPDEFPEWALRLRRWEIVSLGAFPIALFYTRFAFDFGRFVGNGFQPAYAPWPFKNEYSYRPTDGEQRAAFLTAAGLALAVGAVDAILLRLKDKASP